MEVGCREEETDAAVMARSKKPKSRARDVKESCEGADNPRVHMKPSAYQVSVIP
jgi:hypothetical protein